jgi:F-type H+-transporting ATPase subunit gamma
MRQRLKAIGTIKKITSAMRLISRSFHTRMNKKKITLDYYNKGVKRLFTKLQKQSNQWDSELFFPKKTRPKELYIIIGAQKGLCGNYNAELSYWIKKQHSILSARYVTLVAVGKKTQEELKKHNLSAHVLEELKAGTLSLLTDTIVNLITNAKPHYSHVKLIYSAPESFFVHRFHTLQLIPFMQEPQAQDIENDTLWLNTPKTILDKLAHMTLHATLYETLFDSLLGEQSARFIAMDGATRNANSLLEAMKLEYNKLRQAKITKELTELTHNLQQ